MSEYKKPLGGPAEEDYDFLTEEQWAKVFQLLQRDFCMSNWGFDICPPSYPEAGQEAVTSLSAGNDHWIWADLEGEGPLSKRILRSIGTGEHDEDELLRMIMSLENTKAVLVAAYKRAYGHEPAAPETISSIKA